MAVAVVDGAASAAAAAAVDGAAAVAVVQAQVHFHLDSWPQSLVIAAAGTRMAVDTLLATAAVHTDRAAWMVQQLQQSSVNHMGQAVIALVAMDTAMEAVQALIQQLLVRLLVQLVVAVSE